MPEEKKVEESPDQVLLGEPDGKHKPESSAADLENFHPADGADHLENLPLEEQREVIRELPLEDAAEFITEMERHDQVALMRELSLDRAAGILGEMSPDDAADVLDQFDEGYRKLLLKRVEDEDALEIERLMRFDPDTAGGVMNTEVMVLEQGLTADQAISLIRKAAQDTEIPYYAYVVDKDEKLMGVLSLRDLMVSRPGKLLKDLMQNQTLITATFDVDKEEVAHLLGRYNFLALPIVDYEQRLLGIVTHDDVIDIIHEEASEDMLGMVGAGHDETVDTPWLRSVLMRLPWLVVNVANSSVAAWVVYQFQGTIAQMAILAALMPIVANQAGNAGQQSLAVMIRHLALERFDRRKVWAAVYREAKIGVLNGLVVALLAMAGVFFLTGKPTLAGVMAVALGLDMIVGSLAGASFPLILKEMGRDPAQASSIFLTTVTDSTGFFIFLSLAGVFLL